MRNQLTVSKAAERVGVHPQTLRNYERRGLIEPRRHPVSGWRVYDPSEVERLRTLLENGR